MSEETQSQQSEPKPAPRADSSDLLGGIVLIALGVLFLLGKFVPDFSFSDYWPVLLIVVGAGLLWKARKGRGE
jgi:hypothetical protein